MMLETVADYDFLGAVQTIAQALTEKEGTKHPKQHLYSKYLTDDAAEIRSTVIGMMKRGCVIEDVKGFDDLLMVFYHTEDDKSIPELEDA